MGIISRLYFEKGETAIANAVDLAPNSDLLGNGVSLEGFIERYEREILNKLFGYDLYSQFKLQFDIDPATGVWTLKGAATGTQWDWLLNGYEYTQDGIKVKWQGLIFSDGGTDNSVKQSLIAYYVYTKFIEATAFQNTGVGMSASRSKNGTRVDANADVALAYNDFYALAIGSNYNQYNVLYNGGIYQYEGYYSGLLQGNGYKSLYDFINDMNVLDPTNFENWTPSYSFKPKNRLGL